MVFGTILLSYFGVLNIWMMQSGCLVATRENSLVLYDENAILPHHKPNQSFVFGQHKIVITQSWSQDGVAGVVWDAAVVLCEYLVRHSQLIKGRKVLELGAGTGLAGICAYLEGSDVTLTDRSETIKVLEENVLKNKASNQKGCSCGNDGTTSLENDFENTEVEPDLPSVPVSRYFPPTTEDPGYSQPSCANERSGDEVMKVNEDGCSPLEKGSPTIHVEVLDWSVRGNRLFDIDWDLVIGADIIYIESTFDDLLNTMKLLKCSEIVLSCRLRYAKDHKFVKRAKEYFKVELIFYDESRDIRIFNLKNKDKLVK